MGGKRGCKAKGGKGKSGNRGREGGKMGLKGGRVWDRGGTRRGGVVRRTRTMTEGGGRGGGGRGRGEGWLGKRLGKRGEGMR